MTGATANALLEGLKQCAENTRAAASNIQSIDSPEHRDDLNACIDETLSVVGMLADELDGFEYAPNRDVIVGYATKFLSDIKAKQDKDIKAA